MKKSIEYAISYEEAKRLGMDDGIEFEHADIEVFPVSGNVHVVIWGGELKNDVEVHYDGERGRDLISKLEEHYESQEKDVELFKSRFDIRKEEILKEIKTSNDYIIETIDYISWCIKSRNFSVLYEQCLYLNEEVDIESIKDMALELSTNF